MPKDEFDFEDPLQLNGMAFMTAEDTTAEMCDCFIEEFMRMGYNPRQILSLFKDPNYLGMNMVMQNRGEAFVRKAIEDSFSRWARSGSGHFTDEPQAASGTSPSHSTNPAP